MPDDRTEGIDGVHPLQHLINKSVRPPDYEEDSRGWWADKLALGEITNEEFLKRWPKKDPVKEAVAAIKEAQAILAYDPPEQQPSWRDMGIEVEDADEADARRRGEPKLRPPVRRD